MINKILGYGGFILTTIGFSALDSDGDGFKLAALISAIGIVSLFCWSSRREK